MKVKRFFAAVICLLVAVITLLPSSAFALDFDTESSLTLNAVPGVTFQLYRVADRTAGSYELTADFQDEALQASFDELLANVDLLEPKDAALMVAFAAQLTEYVSDKLAQGIELEITAWGTTEDDGVVRFVDLPYGLYLVWSEPTRLANRDTYRPEPFLVSIPYLDLDRKYVFDVVSDAKFSIEEFVPDWVSVWKSWEGEGPHPKSIVAQLFCDGEFYDEVTLNNANNWHHVWDDLDSGHTWTIKEKNVPEGYVGSVASSNGKSFMIINRKPGDELPKTGQLWWPVPVMLGASLLLLIIGLLLQRSGKNLRRSNGYR